MKTKRTHIYAAGILAVIILLMGGAGSAQAAETLPPLELQPLINEALKNNHDVWVSEAKWRASTARIKQAGALPDPMVMVGYQNEGWSEYTYGKMLGAQWMFQVSQMFPFPGKRSLKESMASQDAETAGAIHDSARLATVAKVKELYYDLTLVHKDLDLVRERAALFAKLEEAALARYATGMARQQEVLMAQTEKYMLLERSTLFAKLEEAALARYATGMARQQEVLMAQTEKYMLLERETMLVQKRRTLEAMLASVLGRDGQAPFGRPVQPAATVFTANVDDLVLRALERSPEVRSREKMLSASQSGVQMAEKEYYPDVTLSAWVATRTGEFQDMWALTATFNIPLYFKSRQGQALAERRAMHSAAVHDLAGIKAMLTSSVRENYAMVQSADQLMSLYRQGLIPKTEQDIEQSLAAYRTGKIEGPVVVGRLKSLLDYENAYWAQFTEREKAIARLEALTGTAGQEPAARSQE